MLFKLQDRLMAQTKETLIYVGRQHGMSEQDVKACEEDQAQFDKLNADQRYAHQEVKVTSTPTFFLNGIRLQGSMSFEELEEQIQPLLK
jgi:protein-disulfide isomerase